MIYPIPSDPFDLNFNNDDHVIEIMLNDKFSMKFTIIGVNDNWIIGSAPETRNVIWVRKSFLNYFTIVSTPKERVA